MARAAEFVRRFEVPTRLAHWALAVPFLLLLLTGLTNYLPRLKALAIGGFRVFAWAHVLLGFAMVVIAVLVVLSLLRSRSMRGDAEVLAAFGDDDVRWLEHEAMALAGQRTATPRVGKFNAGQKINAAISALATIGLLGTGVILGINTFSKSVFTVGITGMTFSWHTLLALATIPVVLGHVYLAALNPATRESLRGITRGFVRRDWAMRHHPDWTTHASEHELPPEHR
ncbi:MAG: cytochrome b/b6 domain-containing protein [Chloroflexota bacterium]